MSNMSIEVHVFMWNWFRGWHSAWLVSMSARVPGMPCDWLATSTGCTRPTDCPKDSWDRPQHDRDPHEQIFRPLHESRMIVKCLVDLNTKGLLPQVEFPNDNNIPSEVIHEPECFPHMRLVEGQHSAISRHGLLLSFRLGVAHGTQWDLHTADTWYDGSGMKSKIYSISTNSDHRC